MIAVEEITPAVGTLSFTNDKAAKLSAPVTQKQSQPECPPPKTSAPVSAPTPASTPASTPAQPASKPEKQKVPHNAVPVHSKDGMPVHIRGGCIPAFVGMVAFDCYAYLLSCPCPWLFQVPKCLLKLELRGALPHLQLAKWVVPVSDSGDILRDSFVSG